MTLNEIIADLNSPRKKKVVLDTDAYNEIDDQYAIAYCYLSERIDLLSVHAALFVHNEGDSTEAGMLQSYEEAKKVLSLTDAEYKTPVLKGCPETIDKTGSWVDSEATRRLIEIAHESDEIVYVLAIGTGTNVASSLLLDPSIKDKICVIWLACSQLHVYTPVDYNLEQDYKAGQVLFDSGVPLIIVPGCWVTSVLRSDIENTRALLGYNPICDYLAKITEDRYNMVGRPEGWARTIWDLGAPAIIENPECCQFDIIKAPVLTDERLYAFSDDRHEMIMVNNMDRDPVFEKAWATLKKGKQD